MLNTKEKKHFFLLYITNTKPSVTYVKANATQGIT